FSVLLGSGLVLYVPRLSTLVSRRPLIKDVHVYTAVAWIAALALVVAIGDRRGLRTTLRELDLFDEDDRLWLRGARRPQGRFNAGQKLNAAFTAGDRKSTRLNSSHVAISYAVFCLKKKKRAKY